MLVLKLNHEALHNTLYKNATLKQQSLQYDYNNSASIIHRYLAGIYQPVWQATPSTVEMAYKEFHYTWCRETIQGARNLDVE